MKRAVERYGPICLILVSIVTVYHGWLTSGVITFGDWGYYSTDRLRDFWPIPSLWDGSGGTGGANILAGPLLPLLFLDGLLNHLGMGFAVSERLVWIFPAVLVSALATYALAVSFFSSRLAGVVGALFAAFNSYLVVIMTGGQFTVGTAYALMPLALWLFYRALCRPSVSRLALAALSLAIQVMYDPRSTYLTLGVLCLFAMYYMLAQRSLSSIARAVRRLGIQFVAIGLVAFLVHALWLLPSHFGEAEKVALPAGYNSSFWVHVLSYMQLSHAFAVFHPFWYQRVYPWFVAGVDPSFFLLPLLVFGVFLRRHVTYIELFLFSLALLAIFFVKGSNAPAGNIYDWLFLHLPGFSMYRDPSKFYQPLALACALLLGRAATLLPTLRGTYARRPQPIAIRTTMTVLCFLPALIPVVPVVATAPWGTFVPAHVPAEYLAFQHYIDQQPQFFRTLWIPGTETFGVGSALHPTMGANGIGPAQLGTALPDPNDPASWLKVPQAKAILRVLSVKYIVVADEPWNTDPQFKMAETRDIALVRRTFPHFAHIRIGAIHLFANQAYLPNIFVAGTRIAQLQVRALVRRVLAPLQTGTQRTGRLGEYSTSCYHCFSIASQTRTRYEVVVQHVGHPFLLVLGQSFDPNWAAYVEPSASPEPFWWTWTHRAILHRYHFRVNSFANGWWIDTRGTHRIVVEYWPQRLTDVGFIVCWLTIVICLTLPVVPLAINRVRRGADRTHGIEVRVPAHGGPLSGQTARQRSAG